MSKKKLEKLVKKHEKNLKFQATLNAMMMDRIMRLEHQQRNETLKMLPVEESLLRRIKEDE